MPVLRLKIKITGRLRFLSHLETVKMFERGMRRAKFPMKFSQGFNPHPNISSAAPLPVGVASEYEVFDVDVIEAFDIEQSIENQERFFPNDFELLEGKFLEKPSSLMSIVGLSDYKASFDLDLDDGQMSQIIQNFLQSDEVMIIKKTKKGKRKEVNIRPRVKALTWDAEKKELFMQLLSGSVTNLKPMVLILQLFDFPEEKIYITRTHLYKNSDGKWMDLFE